MKQINITFNNRTFDFKNWQWLYFLIMDLNDFFRQPFCFILGDNITITNVHMNIYNCKINSSKYEFGKMIIKKQKEKL